MPRLFQNALVSKKVEALKNPGYYPDGAGLYLRVKETGRKAWVYRYTHNRKRTMVGLGPYPEVSIKDARAAAGELREQLGGGEDPQINKARLAALEEEARRRAEAIPTFEAFYLEMVEHWSTEWKNAKHREQWRSTVTLYCSAIAKKRISEIETSDIVKVLQPKWTKLPVTYKRVQERLKRVFDAAKIKRFHPGPNPAAWDGHLKLLLTKPKKLVRGHHKALHYDRCPEFIRRLTTVERVYLNGKVGNRKSRAETEIYRERSNSQLALEWTILTASRTNETIQLKKSWLNLETKVCVIPKEVMKMDREKRIPLTDRMIELTREGMKGSIGKDPYVFRSTRGNRLSNMAMAMCLRGLENAVTVHGFRSSFRDWVLEKTEFPGEIAAAALGHLSGDETELAYKRGDALERRRGLMQAWENYLFSTVTEAALTAS